MESGAGGSILSETLIKQWNRPGIKLLRIVDVPLTRQVGLIYHKEKYRAQAVLKFTEILKDHIHQFNFNTV
ncbi:LysR family transcriptional regulator substrate-binding protein [Paenibacillus campinasensis]|uniref:LysR family transcriptional regulator substrate-binding protein n=1 Tax=Paenibacillus campinasensis TaxID=66347 RepID=UPI002E7B56EA|nr:LysR family transcriptional regulator substrate-binding protein [Paenibacillus campinasensis]